MVAGGGAVECGLSIYLEDFAATIATRESHAILEFAEALLVIPKTLSVNAAQDATELVARLRAEHSKAQHGGDEQLKFAGLDLVEVTSQGEGAGAVPLHVLWLPLSLPPPLSLIFF